MRTWRKKFTAKSQGQMYRGEWIERNSPYCWGLGKSAKVILTYGPDGNECYFASIGKAKRYVDRHWKEYVERAKEDTFLKPYFTYADIENEDLCTESEIDSMDARDFERLQEVNWNQAH